MNQNLHELVRQATLRGLAKKADERIKAIGVICHRVNEGPWAIEEANIVVNEGLNHLLDVCLNNGPQSATWYVALFSGLAVPTATLTAATFDQDMTETTAYDETTHPVWDNDPPSSQTISNVARPARFTMNAVVTVRGGALMNTANKPTPNTGNILMACKQFAVPRDLQSGDLFDVGYTLTIASA